MQENVATLLQPPVVTRVSVPDVVPRYTWYEVMAEPPLEAGAAQLSDTWALPAVAATPVGGPGTVATPLWTTTSSTAHPGKLRG